MKRLLLTLALVSACTESELYVPQELRHGVLDNKLRLTGGFCAEGALDLEAYLKVLFIIDRSNSMNVTDPQNQRIAAVRDVIMRFVEDPVTYELRSGVELALISFYGDVTVHTRDTRGLNGFTRDGARILGSLAGVARTGSNTGYDKALASAFLLLDTDMARLADNARARSRYEVIFLSDGMPFPDNCRGESNSPSAAVRGVERIAALSSLYRVPVRVHTAFASDPRMFTSPDVDPCNDLGQESDRFEADYNASLGDETRALLIAMATAGGGSFTQFPSGDAISFQGFELSLARRMYALSNFVVDNESALPARDRVVADSDGDGLSDDDELLLGTRPTLADSDGDGFNDALEWRLRQSGLDPLDPTDAQCTEVDRGDRDGDGLRDCEEILLGTSRRSFDSDADGMPDGVEVRAGSNPTSAGPLQDAQTDSDADGGSNADEVRWHTDPAIDDVAERSSIAYDYKQTELPFTSGRACYEFDVGNISLASTARALAIEDVEDSRYRAGWNRVMLHFAETPYDDPLGEPLFRVACVDARFVEERDLKMPAGGTLELPMRRPSDTYRAAEVLRPNDSVCQASNDQDCGLNALWCRFEEPGSTPECPAAAVGACCNCWRPPQAAGDPLEGFYAGACPACSDGRDNDGDGRTDYPFDPDCFDGLDDDESSSTACKNGLDDDADGRLDWPDDPGCDSAYDADESNPAVPPECADGVDNDGDGNTDFPSDLGCDAASDPLEEQDLANLAYACSDGRDNDGDGLVDMMDGGCFDPYDVDEDGPVACFYCERAGANRPGQCELGAGYCRPRSGIPDAGACDERDDCRGAPCVAGRCAPCLDDADCDSALGAGDGLCDSSRGWCLAASYTPVACADDADCASGSGCDVALGICAVDPYFACRDARDCRPGEQCSAERGFCLRKQFVVSQCDDENPCGPDATCDDELGWCLPSEEDERCRHDDECPFGDCRDGHCDQQTFVFPTDLSPAIDCIRAR